MENARHQQEIILPNKQQMSELYPLSEDSILTVKKSRENVIDILQGDSERLLAIVGPCSMDDSKDENDNYSVIKYAEKLQDFATEKIINENLHIVVRAPVSKPRTENGWAGLSQTNPIKAYELTSKMVSKGIALSMELLSHDDADYFEEMLSIGWVGARNVEDTILRHIVSDLDLPVLFKNSTNGSLQSALNAIKTSKSQHLVKRYKPDNTRILKLTNGNPNTGIIYRGGNASTPEEFEQKLTVLRGVEEPIIVDCSHGNSAAFGEGKKTPESQIACINFLRKSIESGLKIKGLMIESYIKPGSDSSGKEAGKSLTDPCIDFDRTTKELMKLAVSYSKIK